PWGWIIGSGIYVDDIQAIFRKQAMTLGIVLVASLLVIGALTLLIVRSIDGSISRIRQAVQDIRSSRNLTLRVPDQGRDEMSQIANAFNELIGLFQNTIRTVTANSVQVRQLSTEL